MNGAKRPEVVTMVPNGLATLAVAKRRAENFIFVLVTGTSIRHSTMHLVLFIRDVGYISNYNLLETNKASLRKPFFKHK